MITEKETIKCEAVYNEDRTHRYIWRKCWSREKPMVTVVMLNPCADNLLISDLSSVLVTNNIARFEKYGGVNIVNLFSLLTPKLHLRGNVDEEINALENDDFIKKAVDESAIVVLAWGKAADSNQYIADRAVEVINMLKDHKDKLYVITDGERNGLHPLTPQIRNYWELEKVTLPEKDKA